MSVLMLCGFGAVFSPLLGLIAVRFGDSPSRRRSTAVFFSILGVFSALGVLYFGHAEKEILSVLGVKLFRIDPWSSILPALASIVGLANALSIPTLRADASHIGHRLLLISLTNLLFISATPWLVVGVWAGSAFLLSIELGGAHHGDKTKTLFWISTGLALVLAAFGAALLPLQPVVAVTLLALAAWIREAAFPFQSWLVAATDRAPLGLITLYLAPQTGIYVLVRWVLPATDSSFMPILIGVGGFSAIAGALMAVALRSPRRRLGYLWISQTALVALGLETSSPVALAGGLICWVTLGLATASFGLNLSMVEARRGRDGFLDRGAGLDDTPALAFTTLGLGLASVGLPFTFGFIAEDLLIQGLVDDLPWLGLILIIATALNGITVVSIFFDVFGARKLAKGRSPEPDQLPREKWSSMGVLLLLILLGLFPSFGIHTLVNDHATKSLHPQLEHTHP